MAVKPYFMNNSVALNVLILYLLSTIQILLTGLRRPTMSTIYTNTHTIRSTIYIGKGVNLLRILAVKSVIPSTEKILQGTSTLF